MGWHNRITLEQFQRIKELVDKFKDDDTITNTNQLDSLVATKCDVGYTTVKHVRLSEDYEDYCRRTKGKYWYATEQPKERPNLPQVRINKRNVNKGVSGVYEAEPVKISGGVTVRVILEVHDE